MKSFLCFPSFVVGLAYYQGKDIVFNNFSSANFFLVMIGYKIFLLSHILKIAKFGYIFL